MKWKFLPDPVSGAPGLGVLADRMEVVAREGGALKYRYYDVEAGWNASGIVRGSDGHPWVRSVGISGTPGGTGWTQLTGAAAGNPAVAAAPGGSVLQVVFQSPAGEMRYHTLAKKAQS